jgi:hypothetical protein
LPEDGGVLWISAISKADTLSSASEIWNAGVIDVCHSGG